MTSAGDKAGRKRDTEDKENAQCQGVTDWPQQLSPAAASLTAYLIDI